MEQISSILCGISLCGILLSAILLILPLQQSSTVSRPLSVPRVQPLCQISPQEIDRISFENFSLINEKERFVLEDLETLPLRESCLQSLLHLIESFPVGISWAEELPPHPAQTMKITTVSGKPVILDFFYMEDSILVSNGSSAQSFPEEILSPFLQPQEAYVDTTILREKIPAEGNLTVSGSSHSAPLQLSFYYIEKNTPSFLGRLEGTQSSYIEESKLKSLLPCLWQLQADSIACLEPTTKELENFGLSQPFLCFDVQLPTTQFRLSLSQPSPDGTFYLRKNEEPVIYALCEEQFPLLTICRESLCEEKIFQTDYDDCTTLTVSTDENQLRFTKWDGVVLCKGKQIEETSFKNIFNRITNITPCGLALTAPEKENSLGTLQFSYTNPDKPTDILQFLPYDETRLLLSINGESRFLCEKEIAEDIFHRCFSMVSG